MDLPLRLLAMEQMLDAYIWLMVSLMHIKEHTYVLQDFLACREYIYAAIDVILPNVIKKYNRGSAIPYIVIDMLADLKIPLPCMEEQQKIGSFLAEIDKEIQIQKEFIKTYAEGKKRMMRELME